MKPRQRLIEPPPETLPVGSSLDFWMPGAIRVDRQAGATRSLQATMVYTDVNRVKAATMLPPADGLRVAGDAVNDVLFRIGRD